MASADKSSGSRGADEDALSTSDSQGPQADEADEADVADEADEADEVQDEVDEWGEESFPASDPPASWSGPPDT